MSLDEIVSDNCIFTINYIYELQDYIFYHLIYFYV